MSILTSSTSRLARGVGVVTSPCQRQEGETHSSNAIKSTLRLKMQSKKQLLEKKSLVQHVSNVVAKISRG